MAGFGLRGACRGLFAVVLAMCLCGCGRKDPVFTLGWCDEAPWGALAQTEGLDPEVGQGALEKRHGVDAVFVAADYEELPGIYRTNGVDAVCLHALDLLQPSIFKYSVALFPVGSRSNVVPVVDTSDAPPIPGFKPEVTPFPQPLPDLVAIGRDAWERPGGEAFGKLLAEARGGSATWSAGLETRLDAAVRHAVQVGAIDRRLTIGFGTNRNAAVFFAPGPAR